jgi:carboxylate-amine ligase
MSKSSVQSESSNPVDSRTDSTKTAPLGLFEGWGIEIEYMIVQRDSLQVAPVADKILEAASGNLSGDAERGPAAWSNELVLHVLEMKTNGPAARLEGLSDLFAKEVVVANQMLARHGARLMPTAMHPLMNPALDSKIWPHDNNVVYEAYNRIFDCRGHGWSNLQSMHINLPFGNDEEFGRLHAAIRLVLPLIPMLASSSPLVEGKLTGSHCNRLEYYRRNQAKVPEIAGAIIPEPVFSRRDYTRQILEKTWKAITPHDPDKILRGEWLNSRGAIARFDRDAIEIRLIDTQESPRCDIAVACLISSAVESLCQERHTSYASQKEWDTAPLADMLLRAIREGDNTALTEHGWMGEFGFSGRGRLTPRAFLEHLVEDAVRASHEGVLAHQRDLEVMLRRGTLASTITKMMQKNASRDTAQTIKKIWQELCLCLEENRIFHEHF